MITGIGLSGGADSAFAAWLLLRQGCQVRAFTMSTTPESPAAVKGRQVADRLEIPHEVLDLGGAFEREILAPFADAYAYGETPSPCAVCNARLKFGLLAEAMLARGCTAVATGHYARNDASGRLFRGADPIKDQSYFLARLTPSQLRQAAFPLGEWQKQDVLAEVRRLDLVPVSEKESQDLCFLPSGDFAEFVLQRHPELRDLPPGRILKSRGKFLGHHDGAFQYTPGQRRGLGLGGGPWYVLKTDVQRNLVVVGTEEESRRQDVSLRDFRWLVPQSDRQGALPCQAQLRFRMKPRPATVEWDEASAVLHFAEPVTAVAPGQLAVCYDGNQVIASGWIQS
ncbi:MAG: tRNA 2-thiouridine(34) synthase MnmA [Victivallales bacterium]|nr:tRNA 2-thiouridine(34) synthase MnmA [Victivallales bacterium]